MAKASQWVDRISKGPCDWRYESSCWSELATLKQHPPAMGAVARLEELVSRVKSGTISEVQAPPLPAYRPNMAGALQLAIGELRAFRRKQGKRVHVRIYYTQPELADNLVLGAKLGEKPDNDDPEWRETQNEHMGEAAFRHLAWIKLPADQRVCASAVTSEGDQDDQDERREKSS